jgi:hypothetical protein
MLLQILSAILPEAAGSEMAASLVPWVMMLGFGAYHGLNPGMGWLFALSLGLQRRSARAIWVALAPIAAGHAAALAAVAVLVLAGIQFLSMDLLQALTAALLLGFGAYKVFNYYRHPRWVGMKVNLRDLTWWSFLMATAHGAGLMIAPVLVGMAQSDHAQGLHSAHSGDMALAVAVHTLAMLMVMALVAWVVYRYVGLAVLRQRWVNFDLLWAIALLVVGGVALIDVVGPLSLHAEHLLH